MTKLILPAAILLIMCAHARASLLDEAGAAINYGVRSVSHKMTAVLANDTDNAMDAAARDELPKLPPWTEDENWPNNGRSRGHSGDPGGLLRPCGGPLPTFNLRPLFRSLIRGPVCTCSDCADLSRRTEVDNEDRRLSNDSGIGVPPSSPPEFDEIKQSPADEAL